MKINKYISIDEEIFHSLTKEINASELINELLKSHYNNKSMESVDILKQKIREIKQINKENRKREKELVFKLNKIDKKNKDFLESIKVKFPKELINELKNIDNLDYEAAVCLARDFDLPRLGIGGVRVIKLWEEIKKNVAV